MSVECTKCGKPYIRGHACSTLTSDLTTRLREGSGPDRELDADIDLHFYPGELSWKTANYTMDPYPVIRRPNKNMHSGFSNAPVPAYTGSLDAIFALVEREFPRKELWHWHASNIAYVASVYQGDDLYQFSIVSPFSSGGAPRWDAFHKDLPRAACLALIAAKEPKP